MNKFRDSYLCKIKKSPYFDKDVFGDRFKYPIPSECDLIVLCVDRYQHCPKTVLLPHQIYRKELIKLYKKYPNALSFTIMPVRSSEKITSSFEKVLKEN